MKLRQDCVILLIIYAWLDFTSSYGLVFMEDYMRLVALKMDNLEEKKN